MTLLLPLGLAFLMLVVGLRLTLPALAATLTAPRALIGGLVVQVVALPVTALVLAQLFQLSPQMTAGLLIVAAAPGGITSNYVALAARADLALSIALTLVTNLTAFISIPLVLAVSGVTIGDGAAGPLARMSATMFAVTAVPLAAGLACARLAPGWSTRAAPWLDRAARLVFAAIVIATFIDNRGAIASHAASAGPAALALNGAAIALGLGAGRLLRLKPGQTRTIAIEAGMQNIALALFVSTALLGRGDLALVGLVYAVIMNITALGFLLHARRGGR